MGIAKKRQMRRAGRGASKQLLNAPAPKGGPTQYTGTERPERATSSGGVSPDIGTARVIKSEG